MDILLPAVAFVIGIITASVAGWLICKSKVAQAIEAADTANALEKAVLEERLQHREQSLAESASVAQQQEAEIRKQRLAVGDLTNKLGKYHVALMTERKQAQERLAELVVAQERMPQQQSQIADLQTKLGRCQSELAAESKQSREKAELLQAAQTQVEQQQGVIADLQLKLGQSQTQLEAERKQSEEKLALIENAQIALSSAFKALAAEALNTNNKSFLELAKSNLEKHHEAAKGDLEKRTQAIDQLVKPVKESLEKVDLKIQEIEKARVGAYSGITEQIKSLMDGQTLLRNETSNLVRALRSPTGRGQWGEIQLRRVVEMAGMLSHCDFYEQQSVNTENGPLRPDLLVKLPSDRNIVVDAKAPLSAYLEAVEAQDDDTRAIKLKQHAQQVRNHLVNLGKKAYSEQFKPTPEFVVMFLPGEAFFCAALMEDPSLIEFGVDHNVIVATPTTLIALLKAVAYGWRQELLAKNAEEISKLGKELYERCSVMGGHMLRIGKSLHSATEYYNKAVGSLESRVLITARKFADLGAVSGDGQIEEVLPVEIVPRQLQAPELLRLSDEDEPDGAELDLSVQPR